MIADTRQKIKDFVQNTQCSEDELLDILHEAYTYGYDDGSLSGQTYTCPEKDEIKFYFFKNNEI